MERAQPRSPKEDVQQAIQELKDDFVGLAKTALSERPQDIQAFIHRIAKRRRTTDDNLSRTLIELLRNNTTKSHPLRRVSEAAIPTNADTRVDLLRVEEHPHLPLEPVYDLDVWEILSRLVMERKRIGDLLNAGLEPTRTALFTGPPGVGKTLGARWVARELGVPLMILDLSTVMSSYLGRTGSNLRHVLDHAKSVDCVLLIDEFDAIAKRRDDSAEIGELKRLVTVLLQQLDDWPSTGLLIAATNHSELLDPAIWRRFEQPVKFNIPTKKGIHAYLEKLFNDIEPDMSKWIDVLSVSLVGHSYNDIEREFNLARRSAVLNGKGLEHYISCMIPVDDLSKCERTNIAAILTENDMLAKNKVRELTGVSYSAMRSHLSSDENTDSRT